MGIEDTQIKTNYFKLRKPRSGLRNFWNKYKILYYDPIVIMEDYCKAEQP